MDLYHFMAGLLTVLQPLNILIIFAGLMIGVVAGSLPGITFFNLIVMVLPFTYLMEIVPAVLLLIGIYSGGVFGGSITGILFNIPGDSQNVPTMWEGYKLNKQGYAGKALGMAIICSAIGGFLSGIGMSVFAPWFARFALTFSSAEYFSVVLLGLMTVVVIGQHSLGASTLSLFTGLFLGAVGLDSIYGVRRFTFELSFLDGGINFITALIGMFAIGEVIDQVTSRSRKGGAKIEASQPRTEIPPLRELIQRRWSIVRGFFVGFFVGVVPAAGATVASFVSYGIERACSSTPEKFGTGHWEGLVASETAVNASTGGAMIPLLTLGIPGSAATAVILAALILHGIQPGPLLFVENPKLIYTVFASVLVANFLMIFAGLAGARLLVYVMRVPHPLLMAFIVSFCLIGAYILNNSMADVWVTLLFGIVGFLCRKFGLPTTPMLLGLILGPLGERFFVTTMMTESNDWTVFFTRPISAVFIAFAVLMLIFSFFQKIGARRFFGRRS